MNKNAVKFSFCLLLILLVFSCERKAAVLFYDPYFPQIFPDTENWQKKLEKAASQCGYNLSFTEIEVSGPVPNIRKNIDEAEISEIIISPVFSPQVETWLNIFPEQIFFDFLPNAPSLGANHITDKVNNANAIKKSIEYMAKSKKISNADIYAFFLTDSAQGRTDRDNFLSFSKEYFDPNKISIIEQKNAGDMPDLPSSIFDETPSFIFIDCFEDSFDLYMKIPENNYCGGFEIIGFRDIKSSILFSIEFSPADYLIKLLNKTSNGAQKYGNLDPYKLFIF